MKWVLFMLLRFRFSNFRSFRTEQELSMVAAKISDSPEAVVQRPGIDEGILPVAAIYGTNASGKTNVLRALEFMVTAVACSHRIWAPDSPIPRQAFRLDDESSQSPSEFVVDIELNGTRYQYGFAVDSKTVLEEWLFAYPQGKKQAWFLRKSGKPMRFSAKMPGENRLTESLMRPNSLFLSVAAQNNHEKLTPIDHWFLKILSLCGDRAAHRKWTVELWERPENREIIRALIRLGDLGIRDVSMSNPAAANSNSTLNQLLAFAAGKSGQELNREFEFQHSAGGKTIAFSLADESEGTIAYLSLLGPVIVALKIGGVLCIDELDASLHPLLALQLVRIFNDKSLNPAGAQLIFNTHDTNLLSGGHLRRDQIWFTEKDASGSSQLYPLTDFKPRLGENLENGYLQGRYGAIPFLNASAFLSALELPHAKA